MTVGVAQRALNALVGAGGAGSDIEVIGVVTSTSNDEYVDISSIEFESGDLCLYVYCGNNTAIGTPSINGDNSRNLTEIDKAYAVDANTPGTGCAYTVLDGSESTITGYDSGRNAHIVIVLRGASYSSYSTNYGNSSNPNPPSLSGFSVGDLVVVGIHQEDTSVSDSSLSGYTLQGNAQVSGSSEPGLSVYTKVSDSETEDPGSITLNQSDWWACITLRLTPSA